MNKLKRLKIASKVGAVLCLGIVGISIVPIAKYSLIFSGYTAKQKVVEQSEEDGTNEAEKKDASKCMYYDTKLVEENIDTEVDVVGYMAGALSDDNKSAWLMERPFLSSEEVTNGEFCPVEIQAKDGEELEYNMFAVEVKGTLTKDMNGNYCIIDASCETYKPYDKGYLDQYNTLVTVGYVEQMDGLLAATYEKLNSDDYEEYDTTKLKEIDDELLKSYVQYEYMEQAEYLASNLLALYSSISDETNKKDANTEAQKLYDDFYAHLMQFDLTNLYEEEYGVEESSEEVTGEEMNKID